MPHLTTFLNGELRLFQPRSGYRFSLDAPILADFIQCSSQDPLLEIGTGCGIIPLILHRKKMFSTIMAVEIQENLARLARRNICLNRADEQISIIERDIRQLQLEELPVQPSIIFSNPPYRPVGAGLLNPDPERAIARHELRLSLSELISASARLIPPSGRLVLIHLGHREEEIRIEANHVGFHLARFRHVHSFVDDDHPKLVLMEWTKSYKETVREPPLAIYKKKNIYSAEFERIISC